MFTRLYFASCLPATPVIWCRPKKKPAVFITRPMCLEKGKTKRKIKNLENHRVCYDKIALFVALISMLFIWPTLISAPFVLFMVIRYWNAPRSIIPRTKIRFILAFGIACLQIVAWVLFFGSLISS
jgi:hypothetical protein